MKNLRFVLIAAFSLMLTATSCKKETVEPTPTPAAPVVTPPATELELSVVEMSDWAGAFTSPSIKVVNETGGVDTTIVLSIDTTVVSTSFPTADLCSMTNIHKTKVSKVLPSATSFYRVQFYSGSTLLRTLKVTQSSILDEGASGAVCICSGSSKRVIVYR